MATYGQIYQLQYKDRNEVLTTINIYRRDYTGDILIRAAHAAFKAEWGDSGSSDSLPSIAYGSSVTVYIDAEADFEFLDLFSADSKKHLVEIYKGENLYGKWMIEPDTWTEPLIATPYPCEFTGYDGIGYMSDIDYEPNARQSIKTIIEGLLSDTGLGLEVEWNIDFVEAGGDDFQNLTIDTTIFDGDSKLDVINNLLKGCRLWQRAGKWHITSNDLLIAKEVNYSEFWVEDQSTLNILPALKQLTIKQEYGYQSSVVENGDFSVYNSDTNVFDNWTNVNITPQRRALDKEGNYFALLPDTQYPDTFSNGGYKSLTNGIKLQVPVKANTEQTITFSFKYGLFGYSSKYTAYMFWSAKVSYTSLLHPELNVMYFLKFDNNSSDDSEVLYKWSNSESDNSSIATDGSKMSLKYHLAHVNAHSSSYYFSEIDQVEAYQLADIPNNMDTLTAKVSGFPIDGTLEVMLFVPYSEDKEENGVLVNSIGGACYTDFSIEITDNKEDTYDESQTIEVINDDNNNEIPDDIDLKIGNIPDFTNNQLVYSGGLRRSDDDTNTTESWKYMSGSVVYSFAEFIGRSLAAMMPTPRQKYKAKLCDIIPFDLIVFEDTENPGFKFLETSLTYNDEIQECDGEYAECLDFDIDQFTIEKTTIVVGAVTSTKTSQSSKTTSNNTVTLVNSAGVAVSSAGYLSSDDFEQKEVDADTDNTTGIQFQIKIKAVRGYNLGADTWSLQFSVTSIMAANVNNDANSLTIRAGELILHCASALDKTARTAAITAGTYDQTQTKTIAATTLTLETDATAYFLYIKASLDADVSDTTILVSADHIDPLRDFDDNNYVILKIGYLTPVINDKRTITTLFCPVEPFLDSISSVSAVLATDQLYIKRGNLNYSTTVPALTNYLNTLYETVLAAGTSTQYYRGDKTWATLDTSVVTENSNLYYTNARAIAATLTGYASGAGTVSSSDSVLSAIQKLNGNIAAKESAITAGTSTQYFRGDKTWATLDTSVVTENTNLYFTNARAIASTLTGYTSGSGTISASDTILSAINKLNGNIAAIPSYWVADSNGIHYSAHVAVGGSASSIAHLYFPTTDNLPSIYQESSYANSNGVWIHAGSDSTDYPLLVRNYSNATALFNVRGNGDIYAPSLTNTTQSYVLGWNASTGLITYFTTPTGSTSISGTENYVAKFATNSTLGDSIIYDTGSYVGIGTSSPECSLHIYGVNAGSYYGMAISNYSNTLSTSSGIDFGCDASSVYNGAGNGQIKVINMNASSSSSDMVFSLWSGSAFTERVRFKGDGNIYAQGLANTTQSYVLGWNASTGLITYFTTPTGSTSISGTENYVAKFATNSTLGDSIIYDTGSYVGIGTSSPDTLLHTKATSAGNIAKFEGEISSSIYGSITTAVDSVGRTEIKVYGSNTSAAGAYFTANGYEEAWFNVVTRSNTIGYMWMRFGNLSNRFSIQLLSDSGSSITSTPFSFSNIAPTNSFYMDDFGRIFFGGSSPSAVLQLKAGTATASTAPLKFMAGPLLTTTEAGAIEFDGSHLYFTATNAGTRYQLDQQGSSSSVISIVNSTNLFSSTINAGSGVTSVSCSNFFGDYAGASATSASYSNFFGYYAGASATSAYNSNFLGQLAGNSATSAYNSNFFGFYSGDSATSAANSNFFGYQSGANASGAYQSNFLGLYAGYTATSALNSNFFGAYAGGFAASASYSILIGFYAGYAGSTSNSIGSNNIIIGTNISLAASKTNAMNLGGILFGTGLYSTVTGNPSTTATSGGKIGILTVSPSYTLHVTGSVAGSSAYVNTSDRRYKDIIKRLNGIDSLNKINQLNPVKFSWNDLAKKNINTDDREHIGLIAQEIEEILPEIVSTADDAFKTKAIAYTDIIPILISAMKEQQKQITELKQINLKN